MKFTSVFTVILATICSLTAQIPTSGLIVHFPFTGNANDASGNGYHGTASNVTLVKDRFGNTNSAYQFSGNNNSYISVPSGGLVNNKFTWSVWANVTSTPSAFQMLIEVSQGGGATGQNLDLANNYLNLYTGYGGGGYNKTTPHSKVRTNVLPKLNSWNHLVIVREASYMLLYVNNVLVDSHSLGSAILPNYGTNVKAYIGIRCDLSSPFKGIIDDVRMYNRTLNKREVEQLYMENKCISNQTAGSPWERQNNLNAFTQQWVARAKFTGGSRVAATGFGYGKCGFVFGGTNISSEYGDLYRYNPDSNSWSKKRSMPISGVREPAAFVIDSFAYVGLGFRSGATAHVKTMYKYDIHKDTWVRIADFYQGRRATAGFSIDSLGYIFGGFEYGSGPDNSLYSYSPATNKWTKKATMPGSGRSYPVCVVYKGKAYVMGGMLSNGSTYVNDFYVYDPAQDKWSALTSFPGNARKGASGFLLNGKIYIGNGKDNSAHYSDWYCYDPDKAEWKKTSGFSSNSVYSNVGFIAGGRPYLTTGAYNSTLTDSTWTLDVSPTGIVAAVGFSSKNRGYVFGGTNLTDEFSTLFEFQPDSNKWISKTEMPVSGMREPAAFVIDSFAYVGLGFRAGTTAHISGMYKYNMNSDQWTPIASFYQGRRAATGFSYDTLGYIFGGFEYGSTPDNSLYAYSPKTNKWVKKTSMPGQGRSYAAVAVNNGKAYFACGMLANGSVLKEFYEYNPSTDKWTRLADFPGNSRTGHSAIAIGDYIFVGNGKYQANHYGDWWAYNTVHKKWYRACSFPGNKTYGNAYFSLNGKGYIAAGAYNSVFSDSVIQLSNVIVNALDTFVNGNVCYGKSVQIGVRSGVQSKLKSLWYRDGQLIYGACRDTLYLGDFQMKDTGYYKYVVTGTCNADSATFYLAPELIIGAKISNTDTNVCLSRGIKLTGLASGAYDSVSWYFGNSWLNNNSATLNISSFQSSNAGKYKFTVHRNTCNRKVSDSIELKALNSFEFSAIDTTLHVCKGNGTSFKANWSLAAPDSIYWSHNGSLITPYPGKEYVIHSSQLSDSGLYSSIGWNKCGADTFLCKLIVHQSDTLKTAGKVCAGSGYSFYGNVYYQTGTYYKKLTSHFGCDSVIVLNLKSDTVSASVSLSSDTLRTVLQAGERCFWYNCDSLKIYTTDTLPFFVPGVSGNYAVIVYNSNCSDTSACKKVTMGNISALLPEINTIRIIPNPAKTVIYVTGMKGRKGQLNVINSNGRIVLSKENYAGADIDIASLADGIYVVEFVGADGTLSREKLMIMK